MTRSRATVYLAARMSRRPELAVYGRELEGRGFAVTSRWLAGEHSITNPLLKAAAEPSVAEKARALAERFALEDWEDMRRAEVLISFTEPPRSHAGRGGRHVELGGALAMDKPTIIVGPRENVFHHLPWVDVVDTWPEALDVLERLRPKPAIEVEDDDRSIRCTRCGSQGRAPAGPMLWICGQCYALHDASGAPLNINDEPRIVRVAIFRAVAKSIARHGDPMFPQLSAQGKKHSA